MESIKEVEIWVPHRISGFFQIEDQSEFRKMGLFEKIGSRGGGPALTAYGKTRIILKESDKSSTLIYHIYINNKEKTVEAKTSTSVIEILRDRLTNNVSIDIFHNFDLPQGCGYGSSGCGAIGLAMGLNELFKLGLSLLEIGKIAHFAEVTNYTGLGTVGGQIYGGLSLSVEPGYPFTMDFIPIPPKTKIITCSWGPISTKNVLTNSEYRNRIIEAGQKAMNSMKFFYSIEHFMEVCKNYIKNAELLRILNLTQMANCIDEINQIGIIGASMNQLGESLFCFCNSEQVESVLHVLSRYNPKFGPYILDFCLSGPQIHDKKC